MTYSMHARKNSNGSSAATTPLSYMSHPDPTFQTNVNQATNRTSPARTRLGSLKGWDDVDKTNGSGRFRSLSDLNSEEDFGDSSGGRSNSTPTARSKVSRWQEWTGE
jgi:hypothetical protein